MGAAITGISLCVLIAVILGVALALKGFVSYFSGVIWPLAVAGILALILRPPMHFLETRGRLSRIQSIIVLYAIALCLILGGLAFLGPVLFEQTLRFIEQAPELIRNARVFLEERAPQVMEFLRARLSDEALADLGQRMMEGWRGFLEATLPAVRTLRDWALGAAATITGFAIIPVYLFFFLLTDRDPTRDLESQLSFVRPEWRDDFLFLLREFASIMVAFFRGQMLIGILMGVMLAFGFSLCGLNFAIPLGLAIGILNIIPYLGTIIGLAVILPVAYFQPGGSLPLVGASLLVFAAVQVIESYLLTPRIMGRNTGLHPLAIIIAIFFWGTALNGILGMILAIPLTAFLVVAWRLLRRNYLMGRPAETPGPAPSARA